MRIQYHFCDIPAKDIRCESNLEEISNKPKLRGILHNNWPVIFKSDKVMKVK